MLQEQFFSCFVDDAWELPLNVSSRDLVEKTACAAARERYDARGDECYLVLTVLAIDAVLFAEALVESLGESMQVSGCGPSWNSTKSR